VDEGDGDDELNRSGDLAAVPQQEPRGRDRLGPQTLRSTQPVGSADMAEEERGEGGVTAGGLEKPSRWRGFVILVTAMAASALVATLIATASDDGDAEGESPVITQSPTTEALATLDDRPDATQTVPVEAVPIDETLGAYPGFGDPSVLRDLEDTLGTRLGAVVQFGDQRSADEMLFSIQGALTGLAEWTEEREAIYSVTIPLGFGDADARSVEGSVRVVDNLRQSAAGAHDEQYRTVARRLIGRGVSDAVLRLGHEPDGDWYPWSAQSSCEDYVAAFRHVAELFREESAEFRIEWTGTLRYFDEFGPCAYPGDDVVDIMGLDVYDRGGPMSSPGRRDGSIPGRCGRSSSVRGWRVIWRSRSNATSRSAIPNGASSSRPTKELPAETIPTSSTPWPTGSSRCPSAVEARCSIRRTSSA
jgi:hypothetical protein